MSDRRMSRLPRERLRLLTKVARLYHEQDLNQPEIAGRLGMSQSRVSRLLKEAAEIGIVRTVVVTPPGIHTELEEIIRDRYGLRDVVITDDGGNGDAALLRGLGAAAASYLEATLTTADRVGISSWSATLLATVDAMHPTSGAIEIVQVIGGVGNPAVQVNATRLAEDFARVTGAEPAFLAAPGIAPTPEIGAAFMADPHIRDLADRWCRLTVVLAGIGSLEPSPLLSDSGTIGEAEQSQLRKLGAVGDVCLRFFDDAGTHIESDVDRRVIGIPCDVLRSVPRRIGIAGGTRKHAAIRAAVRGKWIDTLITDADTAQVLASSVQDADQI